MTSRKITPEGEFKRFLYTSMTHSAFSGEQEVHKHYDLKNVTFVEELLKTNIEGVLRIVEIVNSENALPRRETLFFTLALAASSLLTNSDAKRNAVYTTVLQVIRNDEDFFMFIKFISKLNKTISSGIKKIIKKYYSSKEAKDLLRDVCRRKGYHGWTHKDLIKLSHIKTTDQSLEVVLTYILKNISAAEEKAGDSQECLEFIQYMKQHKQFKIANDEDEALEFIQKFKPNWTEVSPQLLKSSKVWEQIVDYIDLKDLINLLLRIFKLGLCKGDSQLLKQLQEILANPELIKKSGVHPIEVFIALRNFEKGGKPKDPKLIKFLEEKEDSDQKLKLDPEYKKPNFEHVEPIKCPPLVSALNKTWMYSFKNIQPTNKRFLITTNVNEKMDKPCLTTKNVTCIEAAVLIILSFLKSEKNVTVAVFNDNTITPVTLDKGGSVKETIKKLKEAQHGSESAGAPFDWAKSKKKTFDVFINIHNESWTCGKDKFQPPELVTKYNAAMNVSNTKCILIHPATLLKTVYGDTNVLDMRGFDKNVSKIIDAFIKNLF